MTVQLETQSVLGGTDGFRGEFVDNINPGEVNAPTFAGLTAALIQHQRENGVDGPLVIGRDTRPSSLQLARGAIQGALACGVEVIDLGIAPTPAVQYVADARRANAMAAVCITASHNVAADNGWKGMLGNRKPDRTEVESISGRYWDMQDNGWLPSRVATGGSVVATPERVSTDYADAIVHDVETAYGERPLAGKLFVVDGANGAGRELTPTIFRRLGADVVEFSCDGAGLINDNCGAAQLGGLEQFLLDRNQLLEHPGFVGAVANDGDADRMMAIGVRHSDSNKELVTLDGNHVLWALAQGEPGIVGTEYTNSGLVHRLRDENIGFESCANGDVFVTQRLRELQAEGKPWRRGGEFTGHHIDTDWLPSGDGVRMAAHYAAYAASQGKTFADLHQELPLWSEKIGKIHIADPAVRRVITAHDLVAERHDFVKEHLGELSRIIIRPSGTEPVVRVWVESQVEAATEWAKNHLMEAVITASTIATT